MNLFFSLMALVGATGILQTTAVQTQSLLSRLFDIRLGKNGLLGQALTSRPSDNNNNVGTKRIEGQTNAPRDTTRVGQFVTTDDDRPEWLRILDPDKKAPYKKPAPMRSEPPSTPKPGFRHAPHSDIVHYSSKPESMPIYSRGSPPMGSPMGPHQMGLTPIGPPQIGPHQIVAHQQRANGGGLSQNQPFAKAPINQVGPVPAKQTNHGTLEKRRENYIPPKKVETTENTYIDPALMAEGWKKSLAMINLLSTVVANNKMASAKNNSNPPPKKPTVKTGSIGPSKNPLLNKAQNGVADIVQTVMDQSKIGGMFEKKTIEKEGPHYVSIKQIENKSPQAVVATVPEQHSKTHKKLADLRSNSNRLGSTAASTALSLNSQMLKKRNNAKYSKNALSTKRGLRSIQ